MKASDVMSSPVITVRPDTTVRALAALLSERRISGVPVLEGEQLVGIVSEADLLRRRGAGQPPARRARDIMTREVETVAPGTLVADIAALLEGRGIRRVPVLQQGQVVGIVSRSNLVQALAAQPAPEAPHPEDDVIRAALLEDHRFPARAPAPAAPEPATQIRRAVERGHSKHGLVDT